MARKKSALPSIYTCEFFETVDDFMTFISPSVPMDMNRISQKNGTSVFMIDNLFAMCYMPREI